MDVKLEQSLADQYNGVNTRTSAAQRRRMNPRFKFFVSALISSVVLLFLSQFADNFLISLPNKLFKLNCHNDEANGNNILYHAQDYLEDAYLKTLSTLNLAGNWSEKYTSEPHLPGTNYGFVNWTAMKFEEFGMETEIDTYDIYVSYPDEHSLKLLSDDDVVYEAPLTEDVLEDDPTTQGDDLIPTFLAYAANGNVTGEYVYCNYGSKEDFELLATKGVNVTGKIAIVRYGGIFRGLKVMFAQEAGAIGVLIYSDPGDDYGITPENGYETYPNGPARNPSSVQRGSVQFLSMGPGDPTTPGYASKPGCERKDPSGHMGKIPVLPISYREVLPILQKLDGHGAKAHDIGGDAWCGALSNYSYSIGPNPDYTLNLYSHQIYNITPLWNVYGKIKGQNSNEVIIIGNHRDAWIKGGAGDPNSGSAVMLEIARAFGELLKLGWKPERDIMFASWDGEEYALLGSTEFGENYSDVLQKKVVAYLNLDVATIGSILGIEASPSLHHVLRETMKKLDYPEGGSLFEHFLKEKNNKIVDLGSGSDYTVFLERLGIPSSDMSFGPSSKTPVYQYHSNYDSYHWMSEFADPGFVYHNLMAKYLGLVALELADRKMINFKLSDYAFKMEEYFNQTVEQMPAEWLEMNSTTALSFGDEHHGEYHHGKHHRGEEKEDIDSFVEKITGGIYRGKKSCHSQMKKHNGEEHMNKPKHPKHPPKHPKHSKHYHLHKMLKKVYTSIKDFEEIAISFDNEVMSLQTQYDNSDSLHWWQKLKLHYNIAKFNAKLKFFERNFLYEKGLKGRSWFRHMIFASGRYTGYEGQQLPGLIEAVEDKDLKEAFKWLGLLFGTLKRVNHSLSN